MSRSGILFILSGASGVGKSTLCKHIICSLSDIQLSVSYTTRPMRTGEEHGREYWFVDEATFRRMIDQQDFLEWAEVYGNLYGTPRQELVQLQENGVDVLLDIDIQGAKNVMRNAHDVASIFLMPPSLDVLKARLEARGTDDSDVVERRFQKAQVEMESHREYEYTIKNGRLEQATREFESIILAERVRTTRLDPTWLHSYGFIGKERQSEIVQ